MFAYFVSSLALRFARDRIGSIGILAALVAPALTLAVTGGLDYGMVISCRMKTDSAAHSATLHGAHVTRETQLLNPLMSQADAKVIGEAAAIAHFTAAAPTCVTAASISASVAFIGDTITVAGDYTGQAPTRVLQIAGIPTVRINGRAQGAVAADGVTNPNMPIDEKFDDPGFKPVSGIPQNGLYSAFNGWQTPSGQLVEINKRTMFEGVPPSPSGHETVLELDRESNSRLAKRVLLQQGVYELRYWYFGRARYDTYTPAWICGTDAQTLVWANAVSNSFAPQTNRISVFMDAAIQSYEKSPPPPSDESRIDTCIDSGFRWIERNVRIDVLAAGPFWLTFAAEGASDSVGGLFNHIRLCLKTCDQDLASPSPSRDNFPWAANTDLFTDNFVLPPGVWPSNYHKFYTLNRSGTNSGWTTLPPGWVTTPVNHVELLEINRDSRWTYILGMDTFSDSRASTTNRSIHRRFLLAPGFYRLSYLYNVIDDMRINQIYCGVNTYAADLATVDAQKRSTRNANTNVLGAFVDRDFGHSSPRHSEDLFATASWRMWDGSAPPSGAPRIGRTMVDACVIADNYRSVSRSVTFRIQKPGYYWLTFAALGSGDELGPRLDNVELTAIGGLSTSGMASAVVIPSAGAPFGSWSKRGRFDEIEVQVQ